MHTERDLQIIAMRQQGKPLMEIAQRFVMSLHRVVEIIKAHEKQVKAERYFNGEPP